MRYIEWPSKSYKADLFWLLRGPHHERTKTMGKLSGKVALVTGGASGIGRAIVGALAAEGANIGIVDRNAAGARTAAEETAKLGVRAISASADVGDEAQMASAFGVVRRRSAMSTFYATTPASTRSAFSTTCRSTCGTDDAG